MKKHNFSTIFLTIILLMGLGLLLYPTVSDYWNSFHSSRAITEYAETVANISDDTYKELWQTARKYNRSLLKRENSYELTERQKKKYGKLLNVAGTGAMGYIEIPDINCSLPIYHGTDDAILQVAVGHLEWSSLPVGGASTHTVLSGHRGLPSAKLFSHLDQLEEGDLFMLRILDEVLTYEVDQILIVKPKEMESLGIEKGKDYCTLVTCTPYAVNTHRLLVRGHRVENVKETIRATADAMQIEPLLVAPIVAMPVLLVLILILLLYHPKKRGGDGDEEF